MKLYLLQILLLLSAFIHAQDKVFDTEILKNNGVKKITMEQISFFNGISDTNWVYQELNSDGQITLEIYPSGMYNKLVSIYTENRITSYYRIELPPDSLGSPFSYKKNILDYRFDEYTDTIESINYFYNNEGLLIKEQITNNLFRSNEFREYSYDSFGNNTEIKLTTKYFGGESYQDTTFVIQVLTYNSDNTLSYCRLFDLTRQAKPYSELNYFYKKGKLQMIQYIDIRSEAEYFYNKNGFVKLKYSYDLGTTKSEADIKYITKYLYSKERLIQSIETTDKGKNQIIRRTQFFYEYY